MPLNVHGTAARPIGSLRLQFYTISKLPISGGDARGLTGTTRSMVLVVKPRAPFAALHESVRGVRRGKAALSSGCKSHPATAPAGSNRSSHGGNEVAEASG